MPIELLFKLGIFTLLESILNNIYSKVVFLIIFTIYLLLKNNKYHSLITIPILILSLMNQNISYENPTTFQGKVSQIKENYYLISNSSYNIVLYSDIELGFDDEIIISGSFSDFSATQNRAGFDYYSYLKANNIRFHIQTDDIEIIKKGKSLRNYIYQKNKDNKIVKYFIFNIYPKELDDNLFLLLGCGMHISFILMLIRSIVNKFLEERQSKYVETLFIIIFGIFYDFSFLYIRILLRNLISYTKLSTKEKWGILTIILFVAFPERETQLNLLLPTLIGLCNCYSSKKRILSIAFVITVMNLQMNGFTNLFQTFSNIVLNPLFSLIYLYALVQMIIPINFRLTDYLSSIIDNWESSSSFMIVTKPEMLIMIVLFILFLEYLNTDQIKYLIIVILLFVLNHFSIYLRPYAIVSYLDVGQGDCCLISLPFNKGNILIDTGGNSYKDVGNDIVYPVLSSYGIMTLDYVIITHEDIDHSGGLESLNSKIEIETIITKKGMSITIDDFMLNILDTEDSLDTNENSLVTFFDIYGTSFLGMADVPIDVEHKICEDFTIKCDVIKLGHHGSDTSNSQRLLETTKAELAIISSGKNNRYHHPSYEIIDRLKSNRIYYLNTAYQGQIEICLLPFYKFLKTKQGGFAIIK